MILVEIERARALLVPYLYLGYWVPGSPTMDYKRRFRPFEVLGADGWRRPA
jgi:arginyl-tRNA--protein-N-Asp/Glu arginylyltransferase